MVLKTSNEFIRSQNSIIDSTVSVDCGSHQIKKACIHDCSQWNLRIDQVTSKYHGHFKGNSKELQNLISIPISEKKSKLFESPVLIMNDLITDLYIKENLHWVLNMSKENIKDLELDLQRESRESQGEQVVIRDSHASEVPSQTMLREMMSSVDITNLA